MKDFSLAGLYVLPVMGAIAWGWRVGVLMAACELCGWVVGRERQR